MKSKILGLLIISLSIICAPLLIQKVWGVRVNPASNVSGDSANTGLTIVYRDSAGDFSAGNITATSFTGNSIPSDAVTARAHIPVVSTNTLTTTSNLTAGDLFLVNFQPGNYALCVATGTGQGAVVRSTNTVAACRDIQ